MTRKVPAEPEFIESSGNVFADLGLPDAEELLAKAELVRQISALIDERGLTQAQAAEVLGTNQPTVSDLVRGRLGKFSIVRLILFLNRLDHDVELVVRPKPAEMPKAQFRVAAG